MADALEEFLRHAGLQSNLGKLTGAGITSIAALQSASLDDVKAAGVKAVQARMIFTALEEATERGTLPSESTPAGPPPAPPPKRPVKRASAEVVTAGYESTAGSACYTKQMGGRHQAAVAGKHHLHARGL